MSMLVVDGMQWALIGDWTGWSLELGKLLGRQILAFRAQLPQQRGVVCAPVTGLDPSGSELNSNHRNLTQTYQSTI